MNDDGIKKLYYSIGEVSEITDLEQHVLRYWESEFEHLKPRKNRAGRRVYTEEDIQIVLRIQHLLKTEKYTIEGARQVLEQDADPAADTSLQNDALLELRGFLSGLLDKLDKR